MAVEMLYGRLATTRGARRRLDGGAEIDAERVGLDERKVLAPAEAFTQQRDEVTVELDGDDARAALQQQLGQSAATRPDLDDGLARPRRERADDAPRIALVDEKILTQTLFRARESHKVAVGC